MTDRMAAAIKDVATRSSKARGERFANAITAQIIVFLTDNPAPCTPLQIAKASSLRTTLVAAHLMMLEVQEQVHRLPSGKFVLSA